VWSLSSVRTTNPATYKPERSAGQTSRDMWMCICAFIGEFVIIGSHTMVVLIFHLRRNKVTSRFYTPVMTETKLSQHAYNTIITRQWATLLQQMVYIPTELR